jgi:hypothetical protein
LPQDSNPGAVSWRQAAASARLKRIPQSPALHPQLGYAARAVLRQSPPELFSVSRKQL